MRRLLISLLSLPLLGGILVNPAVADTTWEPTPFATFAGTDQVNAIAKDAAGNLYVGGIFATVDGESMSSIAKYEPATNRWSSLGTGVTYVDAIGTVEDIVVAPDGIVYVTGRFTKAGDVSASHIAAWNPTTRQWSALGSGLTSAKGGGMDLEWHDGNLYVAGPFSIGYEKGNVSGMWGLAKWDGSTWGPIGGGFDVNPTEIAFDGNGTLYVGGHFERASNTPRGVAVAAHRIARWDGDHWTALAGGLSGPMVPYAMEFHDGKLYVGGLQRPDYTYINPADWNNYLNVWDGTAWSTRLTSSGGQIRALAWDANNDLIVGGLFFDHGTKYLARWNNGWEKVPGKVSAAVLDILNDGVNELYVGGMWKEATDASFPGKFARMSVTTGTLDITNTAFPTIPLDDVSTLAVNVTNSGAGSVGISSASVAGSGVSEFTTTCTGTLPQYSTCTVTLKWDPMKPGALTDGKLTINYTNPAATSQTVDLSGTTEVSGPLIFTETDFGYVEIGESKTISVELTNPGAVGAPLDKVEVFGEHVERAGGTCLNQIGITEPCTIDVKWTPTTASELRGALMNVCYGNGEWDCEGIFLSGRSYTPERAAQIPTDEPTSSAPTTPSATSIPGPVTKLKATKRGKITWSPPSDTGNLPITGYKVAVRKSSVKKFHTVATVKKTSYTFKKLKPGKYVAQVSSLNSMGGLLPVTAKFVIAKRQR